MKRRFGSKRWRRWMRWQYRRRKRLALRILTNPKARHRQYNAAVKWLNRRVDSFCGYAIMDGEGQCPKCRQWKPMLGDPQEWSRIPKPAWIRGKKKFWE